MEKIFEYARIAWNPIGSVEKFNVEGTLSFNKVVGPFIAVIIACNILSLAAQKFFMQSLNYAAQTQIPVDNPLIANSFSQKFLSLIGAMIPIVFISLLPRRVFDPMERTEVISAILIVLSAWAFYGVAIGAPVYFFSGMLVMSDIDMGMNLFAIASILSSIFILCLIVFFWCKVLLSTLQLSGGSVTLISMAYLLGMGLVIGILLSILR